MCLGRGCESCNGNGAVSYTSCPRNDLPADVLDALFLVPFVDKGHWPVAGGVLDQTDTFIEACEIVWTEQARWKEKWRKEAESREK